MDAKLCGCGLLAAFAPPMGHHSCCDSAALLIIAYRTPQTTQSCKHATPDHPSISLSAFCGASTNVNAAARSKPAEVMKRVRATPRQREACGVRGGVPNASAAFKHVRLAPVSRSTMIPKKKLLIGTPPRSPNGWCGRHRPHRRFKRNATKQFYYTTARGPSDEGDPECGFRRTEGFAATPCCPPHASRHGGYRVFLCPWQRRSESQKSRSSTKILKVQSILCVGSV